MATGNKNFDHFMESVKDQRKSTSVGFTFPSGMTDDDISKIIKEIQSKHRARLDWARRYNSEIGTPVFYIP